MQKEKNLKARFNQFFVGICIYLFIWIKIFKTIMFSLDLENYYCHLKKESNRTHDSIVDAVAD